MTTILIKKRDTAGAPTAGDLTNAAGGVEIAVNTSTKRVYSKDSGGNIIELSTNPTAITTGQVNITGQGDLRLEDTTGGEYVALQAPTSLASSYTLTLPIDDGTNGQALITDGNGNLSWSTAASGDVYGPASATDNAVARFDLTTGKLIQNSVVTIGDTGDVAGVGALSMSGAVTLSGGTANGVAYLNGSKVLTTGSAFVFDGSNLGLGVTPSAWNYGGKGIDFGSNGFVSSANNAFSVLSNAYYNGSAWTYKASSTASWYLQTNGQHQWYTAPSGTAGNAISFTQAMTLDASGNLRIGATGALATSERLTVASSNADTFGVFQQSSGITAMFGANATGSYSGSYTNQPHIVRTNNTERMRIDTSGNVGIGTSSPNQRLHVAKAAGATPVSLDAGEIVKFENTSLPGDTRTVTFGTAPDGSGYIRTISNMVFATVGAERMRIDTSGNVGIGTSSPGVTLDVNGTIRSGTGVLNLNNATQYKVVEFAHSGTRKGYIEYDNTNNWVGVSAQAASSQLIFKTADTERMRIDSSGNVGIGTSSPSVFGKFVAWGGQSGTATSSAALSTAGAAQGEKADIALYSTFQGTSDNGPRRTADIIAGFNGGAWGNEYLSFNVGNNGSSNDTKVVTSEKMRIDSSGNVGIGTSSPTDILTLGTPATTANQIRVNSNGNPAYFGATADVANISVNRRTVDGSIINTGKSAAFITLNGASGGSDIEFCTAAANNTQPSERMRIDSSGNVGIGITSVGAKLDIASTSTTQTIFRALNNGTNWAQIACGFNGASVNYYDAGTQIFRDASQTERMRIDSSGNLFVGTTSQLYPASAARLNVDSGANGTATFKTSGGVSQAALYAFNASTTNNAFFITFGTEATWTERGSIIFNRAAGQTQLQATSDARLKEDYKPVIDAISTVSSIQVRDYKWKDSGNRNVGFIAQELYKLVPNAVCVGQDNEDGSIKRPWGVDNSAIVPYLVKAIQELKAELDATKAEVAALKAN